MTSPNLTKVVAGVHKEFAFELGEFGLGDLVDSFGCETGRPYMPGTGEIIAIKPKEERPFLCAHNNQMYSYKASEIEHTDLG